MSFTLISTANDSSQARRGELRTAHGTIQTPIFMPVGTAATVKSISPRNLKEDINAQIILANTYHLYLRPGTKLISQAGGIHRFMSWDRPVLTDSGGFQVFSLKDLRKLTPDGVEFRSHLDGSKHFFSPESVMRAQRKIGADIIMAFDECTPWPATEAEALSSLNLTRKWTETAMDWLKDNPPLHGYEQLFFGIVQGSMYPNLRQQAVEHIVDLNPDGIALGGLSVGEPTDVMYDITSACAQWLPPHKPRYVMGVGTPWNLLELVHRGMDMFDCVMPSRNARNGMLFTWNGVLNYKAARHSQQLDQAPDENCQCYTCQNFSRAYLRHLHNAKEMLAMHLATIHNLHFYLDLMDKARQAIEINDYHNWSKNIIPQLQQNIKE
ncbi:MAG: tRNA guanosine(34) transglycosylase Tgt [Fibrobacter sp.]|nr:tRNA guanosine(34) transglycosylase Tgt [Fibrobacter sp.]